MKQHGRSKLLNTSDWPKFVETVRPIYEDFELAKLFKACKPAEEIRFKFYLMSGFRDAEGRFVTWRDVDFKHMAVRVTAKPHWGFQPKNWEEREAPVPQKLVTILQKFRPAKSTPDDPLFPSATGRPDGAMLEKLKAVAYRGKMNCGHCAVSHKLENGDIKINRCAAGAYCGRWFLHKFRHTYATRHLQDGIDIRTLQQWMGHRDIASTMVYIKGVRKSDIKVRTNKGSLAPFAGTRVYSLKPQGPSADVQTRETAALVNPFLQDLKFGVRQSIFASHGCTKAICTSLISSSLHCCAHSASGGVRISLFFEVFCHENLIVVSAIVLQSL